MDKVKINFKISDNSLKSGKPDISFFCEHCHRVFLEGELNVFFYASNIEKEDLVHALGKFVTALNSNNVKKVEKCFDKQQTAQNLIEHLCVCDPQVIDIEHLRSLKRAKELANSSRDLFNDKK